jgi:hypothetical protein
MPQVVYNDFEGPRRLRNALYAVKPTIISLMTTEADFYAAINVRKAVEMIPSEMISQLAPQALGMSNIDGNPQTLARYIEIVHFDKWVTDAYAKKHKVPIRFVDSEFYMRARNRQTAKSEGADGSVILRESPHSLQAAVEAEYKAAADDREAPGWAPADEQRNRYAANLLLQQKGVILHAGGIGQIFSAQHTLASVIPSSSLSRFKLPDVDRPDFEEKLAAERRRLSSA